MKRWGCWRADVLPAVAVLAPLGLAAPPALKSELGISEWMLAAMLACAVAAVDGPVGEALTRRPRLRHVLAALFGLGLACLLLAPSWQAQFWIIDDHEIVDALAVGHARTLGGLTSLLARHPEVGSPPLSFPRYRPSYYIVRYLECFSWGANPALWYSARIAMFASAIALTWNALVQAIGPALASLSVCAFAALPVWTDVWCRLGPAEQYGTLGTCMVFAASSRITRDLRSEPAVKPPAAIWLVAAAGSILASGSKENFLFLPAIVLALAALAAVRRKLSSAGAAFTLGAFAFSALVATIVAVSVRRAGKTVYGGSPSVSGPLALLPAGALDLWKRAHLPLIAGVLLLGLLAWRGRSDGWRARYALTGALALFLLVLHMFQFAFYGGNIPPAMRYAFPASLIPLALSALLAGALRRALCDAGLSAGVTYSLQACLAVLFALWTAQAGYEPLRTAVAKNIERTRTFTASIDGAIQRMRSQPELPVVLAPQGQLDYEPAVSVRKFMNAAEVTNPVFVHPPEDGSQPLSRWAAEGLREWEVEGLKGADPRRWKFLPPSARPPGTLPFAIGLSRAAPPGTVDLGRLF